MKSVSRTCIRMRIKDRDFGLGIHYRVIKDRQSNTFIVVDAGTTQNIDAPILYDTIADTQNQNPCLSFIL